MGRHGGGNSDGKTPTDGKNPQGGKRGSGGDTNDNKSDGKRGK
ncbi:hypothetical protein [Actinoallomurus purpureus]|nr:hypothetical protein [Actinoallomurus purpureus]